MALKHWVIGVDGGGTKTLGILADPTGTERARRTAGASNPNVVGLDASARHLEEVIAGCCADAGCQPDDLAAIVLGLAGAGSPEHRQGLQSRLRARFGEQLPVEIVTDARIALEGALGGRPGIVIIAGTGSAVICKAASGEVFTVGGWGRTLWDEGSGFYIGLEAARAMAESIDGLLPPSTLPGALAERYGWRTREDLLRGIYVEKTEPSTLAPTVLELAAGGDGVANDILQRAARVLVNQVGAALPRVGTVPVAVATCGGLIEHPTPYRDILAAQLCNRDARIAVQMPERPAVEGAMLMALDLRAGGGQ